MSSDAVWLGDTDFFPYLCQAFERIVEKLGCRIGHRVCMVGFETADLSNYSTVRIVPEAHGLPHSKIVDALDSVKGTYEPLPDGADKLDVQKFLFRHVNFCSNLRNELSYALNFSDDIDDFIPFCSLPKQVGDHVISIVLMLSQSDYVTTPHLEDEAWIARDRHYRSFLLAIIEVFLNQYSHEMTVHHVAPSMAAGRVDLSAPFRKAGAIFVGVTGKSDLIMTNDQFTPLDINERFDAFNIISSMRYEGEEGEGHLVLCNPLHPAIHTEIKLLDPVKLTNYRKVRKLLAMCDENTWLLSFRNYIYGLGILIAERYDATKEDAFVIRFTKHYTWELVHADTILMRTVYNEPGLPKRELDETHLRMKLWERLEGITVEEVENIVLLARQASATKHGTMLVIATNAQGEAARLKKDSFQVAPFKMLTEQISSVSGIDGAILLDKAGYCHALGAILDGKATTHANSARGARFNSAVRYVEEHPNAVAIVVSEDGMVNTIPE